jgi:hypothetical protein
MDHLIIIYLLLCGCGCGCGCFRYVDRRTTKEREEYLERFKRQAERSRDDWLRINAPDSPAGARLLQEDAARAAARALAPKQWGWARPDWLV